MRHPRESDRWELSSPRAGGGGSEYNEYNLGAWRKGSTGLDPRPEKRGRRSPHAGVSDETGPVSAGQLESGVPRPPPAAQSL